MYMCIQMVHMHASILVYTTMNMGNHVCTYIVVLVYAHDHLKPHRTPPSVRLCPELRVFMLVENHGTLNGNPSWALCSPALHRAKDGKNEAPQTVQP